jgi:hypothetical protein
MASSSTEQAFPQRARILQFSRVRESEQRICLLWPSWAYRVSAPVIEVRSLDLFYRVVLALTEAGVRSADQLSVRIGLHPRLCQHVLDTAVAAGHLDQRRELTETGRESLRTGSSMSRPDWRVSYVFQDPFSGDLWPRTVEQLRPAHVRGESGGLVEILLSTAGRGDVVRVPRILPPPGLPQRPTPARVITASSADQVARKVHLVRDFERSQRFQPAAVPEAVLGASGDPVEPSHLSRVSFIDQPEPVFLVGFIEITAGTDPEGDGLWRAYDPFGLGGSDFFHSLVYRREHEDAELAAEIEKLAESERAQVRERHRQSDEEMRMMVESGLVEVLGPAIRADRDAFALMTDLELAMESSDRDGPLERIAHAAFRLHEVLFRRMVAAYPPAERLPAQDATRRAMIERAAQSIGFHAVHPLFRNVLLKDLNDSAGRPDRGYVKTLVCLALVAADRNAQHPLRGLARQRPDLLVALGALNELRNRGEHGSPDPGSPTDAAWCRDLGILAARGLLELSERAAAGGAR